METSAEIKPTTTPPTTVTPPPTPKLEGEELKLALIKQIDYYFSKKNLMSDRFLFSQMNKDYYVPVAVISGFKMIRNLTEDLTKIVDAMKSTKSVILDEGKMMVKPNIKVVRSTIILREIPSTTPVEQIREIFNNEKCGKIEEITTELDHWFVALVDDSTAVDTLEYIREQKFQDQPLKARIKTENIFRHVQTPPEPTYISSYNPYATPFVPQIPYGYQPYVPYNSSAVPTSPVSPNSNSTYSYRGGRGAYRGKYDPNRGNTDFSATNQTSSSQTVPSTGTTTSTDQTSVPSTQQTQQQTHSNYRGESTYRGRGEYRGRGSRGRGGSDRGGSDFKNKRRSKNQNVPNLSEDNFPPLIPKSPTALPPLPTQKVSTGFSGPFKQYSKEDIVAVISAIEKFEKPTIPLDDELPKIFNDTPDKEILVNKPYAKK